MYFLFLPPTSTSRDRKLLGAQPFLPSTSFLLSLLFPRRFVSARRHLSIYTVRTIVRGTRYTRRGGAS